MGSAEATGGFGGAAVFSTWKGRSYARTKTIPANPKTALQVSVRSIMGFLASQWTGFSQAEKDTWIPAAVTAGIPPYNQFISANLDRWSEFYAPSKRTPPGLYGSYATFNFITAVGGPGHVVITIDILAANDAWGLLIFRSPTGPFYQTNQNCIAALPVPGPGALIYTDHNLPPATWHYNFRQFTHRAKFSGAISYKTAVVT